MKKLLFSFAFACAVFTSNAQFAKGNMYASGLIGFSSSSQGDIKSSVMSVSPGVGYFVASNLSVGIELGVGAQSTEIASVKSDDQNSMTAGVHARYYFTPANKFSFFGNLGVDYMSMNDKIDKVKTTGFGLSVSPAISYFVSDKLAMEASIGSIGYSSLKTDITGSKALNTLNVNFDLSSISYGLVYKF